MYIRYAVSILSAKETGVTGVNLGRVESIADTIYLCYQNTDIRASQRTDKGGSQGVQS